MAKLFVIFLVSFYIVGTLGYTKGGSSYEDPGVVVNQVADEVVRPQLLAPSMVIAVPNVDAQEEIEQVHERIPSSKPAERIRAAVKTKHTFEYRPVAIDLQEDMAPRIIEVAANSVPLEIHFKSASSRIKLVQSHKADKLMQEVEKTTSSDEPQRLQHVVRKPIIQEVREIITPHRKIIQEIQPVMEEIHTIVSHEKERSKIGAARAAQQPQPGRVLSPAQTAQAQAARNQISYDEPPPQIPQQPERQQQQPQRQAQFNTNYEQLRESSSNANWQRVRPQYFFAPQNRPYFGQQFFHNQF